MRPTTRLAGGGGALHGDARAGRALSGEDERALAEVLRTAIAEEAERLAASTRYAESAQGFRDLLERWKSAPSAGQMRDRELWRRFAAAREAFYEQRNRAYAERARERARRSSARRR